MPYPSSQTEITAGACMTPRVFIVSQKTPSDVLASPIVPKTTSLPLSENFFHLPD